MSLTDTCDQLELIEAKDDLGDGDAVYLRAKCGAVRRGGQLVPIGEIFEADSGKNNLNTDQDLEMEVEIPLSLASLPPSALSCSCFDPNCKIKRFFRHRSRKMAVSKTNELLSNNLSVDPLDLSDSEVYKRLHQDPEAKEARARVVESAGGAKSALAIYNCCNDVYKRQNESDQDKESVLIQLCARVPKSEEQKRILMGQIYAFIRIFIEEDTRLLFVRNKHGTSALEYAGLTNKVDVAVYLTRLYITLNKDVNEPNDQGHSVLHLMARKGDACADALEALLKLRSGRHNSRVLRIDVLNEGRKTPLDVAVTCTDLFSTGKERTLYTRVIHLFQEAILEEAKEFGDADMTFQDP